MCNLDTLRELAIETSFSERKIGNEIIKIENLKIHFPQAFPAHLTDEIVSWTYRTKPLVVIDDEHLFGELAILRVLKKDGWDGVWVDTFHGGGRSKVLWSDMPPLGNGKLPVHAEGLYDKIMMANNGKSSGFFDVFAWRNGEYIFIEYKGEGDLANQNELGWIEAAISIGIKPNQMFFVTY